MMRELKFRAWDAKNNEMVYSEKEEGTDNWWLGSPQMKMLEVIGNIYEK